MAYGIGIYYPSKVNSCGHDTLSFRHEIALHLISKITEITTFKEAVERKSGEWQVRGSPGLSLWSYNNLNRYNSIDGPLLNTSASERSEHGHLWRWAGWREQRGRERRGVETGARDTHSPELTAGLQRGGRSGCILFSLHPRESERNSEHPCLSGPYTQAQPNDLGTTGIHKFPQGCLAALIPRQQNKVPESGCLPAPSQS